MYFTFCLHVYFICTCEKSDSLISGGDVDRKIKGTDKMQKWGDNWKLRYTELTNMFWLMRELRSFDISLYSFLSKEIFFFYCNLMNKTLQKQNFWTEVSSNVGSFKEIRKPVEKYKPCLQGVLALDKRKLYCCAALSKVMGTLLEVSASYFESLCAQNAFFFYLLNSLWRWEEMHRKKLFCDTYDFAINTRTWWVEKCCPYLSDTS